MLLLRSAVGAVRGGYRGCIEPRVLYYSLDCRVALDLPFWILSVTMIGKTFHASIIIRRILFFIAANSALLAQDVFLQIFVAVLFCTLHVERHGTRYHLMKA